MNAEFCPNKRSKEFREMSDIFGEDKAYFLWMRNKGNHLDKAPNGAESKLFQSLLDYFEGNRTEALKAKAKVYSNNFLSLFGNWANVESEKDFGEVSKVVDENGEPLVMWHGSSAKFDTFDKSKEDDNIYRNVENRTELDAERERFSDYMDRMNNWLAKKNYTAMSDKEKEKLKADLHKWFNDLNFKYFRLIFGFDKDNYVLYGRLDKDASKDVSGVNFLLKLLKIDITDNANKILSEEDLNNLFSFLNSQVRGESQHMKDVVDVIKQAIKGHSIGFLFVNYISNGVAAQYDYFSNTVRISRSAAFRNENSMSNVVSQTILHELIHAVTVNTIKRNEDLRNDLEKLFNRVKQSAQVAFTGQDNEYGLTNMYEFLAELSNKDFVKTLLNIHTGSDRKNLISLVKDFIHNVVNRIFTRINKENQGTAYADAMEIFVKAALPEDFDINTNHEVLDEQNLFNAISNLQLAAEEEAKRITVRMNILYNEYQKIKSKTPSQERLANLIFETVNELKRHMDMSAVSVALKQAMLTLGQYDPTTSGPAISQHTTIYRYLFDSQQRNYAGLNPEQLVDIYRNSIKFYQDLIDNISNNVYQGLPDIDKKQIADVKNLILNHIMPLWNEAILKVGDDIVDQLIDLEVDASDQDKEDMKAVAKDWLHRNVMYGDLNAVTNYVYNYSYSSNPIIKQAFHLIQHAEQQTLEEMHHIAPKLMRAYQRANSGIRSVTPGWLSIMMEFDDDGKPTGYFIRDLNYGLYQKDLKKFREQLNEDFLKRYGFTYVTDDTGAIVNSLTGEYAEDEEWGPNGEMPKYVEYQREIETFKAKRAHRRYTPRYYLERLTRPYDGTIDPLSPEFKGTRFDHGLSPKTLKRYNYYLSNINYYLNKCLDEKTGLIYPERLSSDDRFSLDKWNARFDAFKSLFNDDGSYKSGEDLKMAYEVRAWLKWIGKDSDSVHLLDIFNAERNALYQEGLSTGNMSRYNTFMKYNASAGINPDFIAQTVGSFKSAKEETDTSHRAILLRRALLDSVKSPLVYTRRLQDMENNPLFWLHCKQSDQAIDDSKTPGNDSGWTQEQVKAYMENFYDREILYVDEYGNYVDENGNTVTPNTPQAESLEEAGKLLTFRQYLINVYTNLAISTGFVNGLIDESTGALISFSGMTLPLVKARITELLQYKKRTFDEDGSVTEEYVPLTIFSMLTPKEKTFFNKRTGRIEPTITYLGEGRFKESFSSFTTDPSLFNPNEGVSEKPNVGFDNGRYDNSQAFGKVMDGGSLQNLYEKLIEAMQESQSLYSTNRKFNYKLPQINAHTAALFSRLIKRGYTEKSLSAIWNSITNIEANDDDMRTKEDYFVGVDGEVANDVPLKFIRDLKNPEDISTDLVSSVIMFADMAHNYKNKSAIDSTLKILRYNMEEATRTTNKRKWGMFGGRALESNEFSIKMFDSMMRSHMYGNQFGGKNAPTKGKIATMKTIDAFLSLESSAMLGLNFFSMSVGFADSLTRIMSESVAGKYMTPGDCLFALGKCLYYTPACIKNMFNPLANNKLTALMLMNGVSKGIYGTYTKADWGKGRKFISNLLMGGWSMLDWMANALLMTAFYHNVRFYDGDVVEKGFYSKYELQQAFLKAGHTKAEARWVHHNFSNYGRRVTLWDAYQYNGKGEVFVKPEFEPYVTLKIKTRIATKTKKRGALYNGMNPDNDVPQWKRDVIGRLVGALRSWIAQQWQHLFAGGTDNIAREFEDVLVFETTSSGTRMKTKTKKKKLTEEQRSRRFAWDYETGTTQDQILIGFGRAINTIHKQIKSWCMLKRPTAKLSEVEKYALKDSIIFLAMLSLMMVGWTYVHDWAREVSKPKNREEAGPASMLNPVDYYDYIKKVYIPNQYYKLAVDDIYFRTTEAKISNVDPFLVLDIWSAATALKSGLDDQLSLIGLARDAVFNDEDKDTVLNQGAYKYYTKGERTLYRGIGPVKNLHTALTYEGATGNLRWYTNKFGKFYRAFGYDFKAQDKGESISGGRSGSGGRNLSGGRSGSGGRNSSGGRN